MAQPSLDLSIHVPDSAVMDSTFRIADTGARDVDAQKFRENQIILAKAVVELAKQTDSIAKALRTLVELAGVQTR